MTDQTSRVSFFELPTDDMERASKFYAEVFKWETPEQGGSNRWAYTAPTDKQGNLLETGAINGDFRPRDKGLDRPLIMILVDDVDHQLKKVERAGGKVIYPAQDERQFGGPVWAVFSDTEGNHMGMYSFGP
ncbi:VOC family protein [Tetragenococcus koreensis]|uniref:VOC family protein n=1 Tax=Tetragenococcus koreensis TaxID=290335 RepID=UPI000F515D25|nr:VOC family protein [Tetragenococcus koreensis]AYW45535.1 glyoxalase [Tetragenococcus koreensis]MCF1618196.1 VOC family protein [Tetragenococcus koreensis]MCF1623043.1 VOC family protein [Tetragenococcus koreensis]MCF1679022.1 VOC family protein [Tetragenococcus koreensis]MCF1681446.1 VOC family protein [Tetragenococcus koreensis]